MHEFLLFPFLQRREELRGLPFGGRRPIQCVPLSAKINSNFLGKPKQFLPVRKIQNKGKNSDSVETEAARNGWVNGKGWVSAHRGISRTAATFVSMTVRENKQDSAMDGGGKPHEEKGNSLKNSVNKSETRKVGITFGSRLSAADVEGKRLHSEGGRRGDEKQCKRERPRSADVSWKKCSLEKCRRTRPHSSEPLSEGEEELGCPWRCCWSFVCGEEPFEWLRRRRCRSLIHCCCPDTFLPGFPPRKCKSICNFSKATFQNCEKISERDFQKVQRSLRLLGFEPSDFGVLSGRAETTPKWKPKRRSPTLSTKISRRSVSLDSLRVEVRRAWLDDRLDESHRRLLAQAAYEEWYFTKERQLREKRQEDRIKQMNMKIKLRDDFQRKKEKSEMEFQKWLSRKMMKRKGQEAVLVHKHEKPFSRLMDTKEKSEKAFLNWKKTKDREMEKIKMERRKEEEKRMEKEKQKAERKVIAEKAFQQWKKKLEENERKRDIKRQKDKRKQEMEERQKRAEGSQISFQMWKEAKDKEIKEKLKQYREYNRTEREERYAQMEERLYEAEQAFEDWLEQVDLRKEKQCYNMTYQKIIPWIPV